MPNLKHFPVFVFFFILLLLSNCFSGVLLHTARMCHSAQNLRIFVSQLMTVQQRAFGLHHSHSANTHLLSIVPSKAADPEDALMNQTDPPFW